MSRLPIFLILVAAFLARSAGNWSKVFTDQGVRFMANDPWHHVRQIHQLVRHFPHRMTFDPYMVFPGGQRTPLAPFMDYAVATLAWVAGFGSPSEHLVDSFAALAPPLFGTLVAVFAYELGRELSGRAAGLIAALTVALVPGQLFGRTLLGFVDHHGLESLLVAATMLFFVRAVESARAAEDTEGDALRGLEAVQRSLGPAIGAGVTLGLYLLTWSGGALVVLVLALWATVQVNVCHVKGRPVAHVFRAGAPVIVTALLVLLPFLGSVRSSQFHLLGLALALAAIVTLPTLSERLRAWKANRMHLPAATIATAAIGVLALRALAPDMFGQAVNALTWFDSSGSTTQLTVTEAEPLLMPLGEFGFSRVWGHFGITLPLSIAGFLVVARSISRSARPRDSLLFVWAAVMLLITFGQNRFEYYSIVTTGLLVGVLAGPWLGRLAGAKTGVLRFLVPLATVVALVLPTGARLLRLAQFHPGPPDDWVETLLWMRYNTPEPFGDAGFFEQRYEEGRKGTRAADYGVMCWWDQGYWVTQIARRPPGANPTQTGARRAARFFIESDERAAAELLRERGYRYVVMDRKGPVIDWGPGGVSGNITEMRYWAGLTDEDLLAVYHFRNRSGRYAPSTLFHEDYYRSMMVRLYLYDGRSVGGEEPFVVEWRDTTLGNGERIKEVTNFQGFDSYEKARAYVEASETSNIRIVGESPVRSCVPLPRIQQFKRVHQSPSAVYRIGDMDVSEVKVFELVSR